jgi:hypothetical protein
VLIVFLVFFILLSIGLGVWGYYGYSGQKELEEAAKKAKADATTANNAVVWYKGWATWAKAAAGQPLVKDDKTDEPLVLDQFHADLAANKFSNEAGFTAVEKMVRADEKDLAWDEGTKKLRSSYKALWLKAKADYEKASADLKAAQENLAKAEDENKKIEKKYEDEWAKVRKSIKTETDKLMAAALAKTNSMENAEKENARLNEEVAKLEKKYQDAARQFKEQSDKMETKVKGLEERDRTVRAKIAAPDIATFAQPNTNWRVVKLDNSGTRPYINLGSADMVQPQMTFQVHGRGPGGVPEKEPKAGLEVLRVIGPHLSLTQVTSLRTAKGEAVAAGDPRSVPLAEGDVLSKPGWSPTQRQHVAIAGVIDLGDGGDTVAEQVRQFRQFKGFLERQGAVVDSYLDLSDRQVHGPGMTMKTDYLILGDTPAGGEGTDPRAERSKKLGEEIAKLRQDAAEKGVVIIPATKYAQMVGYRALRGGAGEAGTTNYRPTAGGTGEGPMMEKKAGDQKLGDEDKDKDKKKDKDDDK